MRNKILVAAVSLVLAFFIGSAFGIGYYYLNQETNVVSANPLETLPPAQSLEPGTSQIQEKEEELNPVDKEIQGEAEGDIREDSGETDWQPIDPPVSEPIPVEEVATDLEDEAALGEKVAYITIDDGPDADNTTAILEMMESLGVKATFFVLGTSVEKNPELVKQIHEAGHAIGNHTYNHIYQETYASDESFWDSVRKTEELVFELIGIRPTLIREPGGKFRLMPEKQKMVREAGYGLVHWNIDSYDSRSPIPNAEMIVANVKRQAEKEHLWPAMVILFHESGGHQSTVEALPVVIQYLQEEGFSLKTLAEMDLEVMADLPKP